MDPKARTVLVEIVRKHGEGVYLDDRRCRGLLDDLCGDCRRENHALVEALRHQVPRELASAPAGTPPTALVRRMVARLEQITAMGHDAAAWAAVSWAIALDVVDPDFVLEPENPIDAFRREVRTALSKLPSGDVSVAQIATLCELGRRHRVDARRARAIVDEELDRAGRRVATPRAATRSRAPLAVAGVVVVCLGLTAVFLGGAAAVDDADAARQRLARAEPTRDVLSEIEAVLRELPVPRWFPGAREATTSLEELRERVAQAVEAREREAAHRTALGDAVRLLGAAATLQQLVHELVGTLRDDRLAWSDVREATRARLAALPIPDDLLTGWRPSPELTRRRAELEDLLVRLHGSSADACAAVRASLSERASRRCGAIVTDALADPQRAAEELRVLRQTLDALLTSEQRERLRAAERTLADAEAEAGMRERSEQQLAQARAELGKQAPDWSRALDLVAKAHAGGCSAGDCATVVRRVLTAWVDHAQRAERRCDYAQARSAFDAIETSWTAAERAYGAIELATIDRFALRVRRIHALIDHGATTAPSTRAPPSFATAAAAIDQLPGHGLGEAHASALRGKLHLARRRGIDAGDGELGRLIETAIAASSQLEPEFALRADRAFQRQRLGVALIDAQIAFVLNPLRIEAPFFVGRAFAARHALDPRASATRDSAQARSFLELYLRSLEGDLSDDGVRRREADRRREAERLLASLPR